MDFSERPCSNFGGSLSQDYKGIDSKSSDSPSSPCQPSFYSPFLPLFPTSLLRGGGCSRYFQFQLKMTENKKKQNNILYTNLCPGWDLNHDLSIAVQLASP